MISRWSLRALAGGMPLFVECLEHSPLSGQALVIQAQSRYRHQAACHYLRHAGAQSDTSHTACSSSGHAIGKAKRMIENGDCDVVITGGHCAMISEFSRCRVLSAGHAFYAQ